MKTKTWFEYISRNNIQFGVVSNRLSLKYGEWITKNLYKALKKFF